jgi:hypothetical protein
MRSKVEVTSEWHMYVDIPDALATRWVGTVVVNLTSDTDDLSFEFFYLMVHVS